MKDNWTDRRTEEKQIDGQTDRLHGLLMNGKSKESYFK
jgi:hypothetical protein